MGTITAIHVAEVPLGPVTSVESALVRTGVGIDGDRLVRAAEASGEPIAPGRQITFIEEEALAALERDLGFPLTAAESRRNVATRGVALNHLVDREFGVGEARFRGVELCEPCKTLERHVARPGVLKGLIHRGGLRAEVIAGGTIRVGDALEPA